VKRHLDLEPVRPAQLGTLADLPPRRDEAPATQLASPRDTKSMIPAGAKPVKPASKNDFQLRPAAQNGVR
jgi:hypothetical protein